MYLYMTNDTDGKSTDCTYHEDESKLLRFACTEAIRFMEEWLDGNADGMEQLQIDAINGHIDELTRALDGTNQARREALKAYNNYHDADYEDAEYQIYVIEIPTVA